MRMHVSTRSRLLASSRGVHHHEGRWVPHYEGVRGLACWRRRRASCSARRCPGSTSLGPRGAAAATARARGRERARDAWAGGRDGRRSATGSGRRRVAEGAAAPLPRYSSGWVWKRVRPTVSARVEPTSRYSAPPASTNRACRRALEGEMSVDGRSSSGVLGLRLCVGLFVCFEFWV